MSRKNKNKKRWIVYIFIITFVLSVCLSSISSMFVEKMTMVFAFIVLFVFIFVGILFDIIGIAIATADERPFHAMAAKRIKHAKFAVSLIKNADKASNICNDVIGDIAGIVSGATGIAIVFGIIQFFPSGYVIISTLMSGIIASLTVGGKALGKSFAIKNSNFILDKVSFFIYHFLFMIKKYNNR